MEAGASPSRLMKLDEDAQFFDFIAFYKKVEFCDRSIRLEILDEYRQVLTASKDGDTEMADFRLGEAGGQLPAIASQEKASEEAAAVSLDEEAGRAEQGSQKEPEADEGSADKANEPAAESSQEAGIDDCLGESSAESAEKQIRVGGKLSEGGKKALDDRENQSGESEKAPEPPEENEAWVEIIPVNSIVLAAKSCVLRAMLSNGMKESEARAPVVLKVTPREKEAFKELLHFIYAGSLSPHFLHPDASIRELVDLLVVGDKFEVGSLMGAVLKALFSRGRTVSASVILALEIPEALEQHPEVKAIITEARMHIIETFKDVESWPVSLEFLTLPQNAVSFLLQSEELDAASEEEIFQGVLVWVRNNSEGTAERQGAMRDLSLHLRFGIMTGEFLLRQVLPLPEMALTEVQERVQMGIYFQAFSDAEKLKSTDPSNQPRAGIQGRRLEILCNFKLDDAGVRKCSTPAEWLGKNWCIEFQKDTRKEVPTVGLYLKPNKLPGADRVTSLRVRFSFHVRVWPTGYWQNILRVVDREFSEDGSGYGFRDALNMSWEEARFSKLYIGPTGEMTIKVLMQERKLLKETVKSN